MSTIETRLARLERAAPATEEEPDFASPRRAFFIGLGLTLAPFPEAKKLVGELLSQAIEGRTTTGDFIGRMGRVLIPWPEAWLAVCSFLESQS
jgi:hypothetical protein